MTEQSFTVAPGRVTALTGALAAGSTIINTSSVSAVWVSSNPNVAPGLGVRLGPKGSTTWTSEGAPVYATPDTGVTTAIAVTVSTDMAPPVNPVDVGVAVATQLLAQGVPSVLTGEDVPVPTLATIPDVSKYASLTIRVYLQYPTRLSYMFSSDQYGNTVIGGRDLLASDSGYITFTTPVAGPYLMFSASTAGALFSIKIYGSNRALPERVQTVSTAAYADPNQAWTSGVLTDLLMPIMTNGGRHRVRLAVTGSAKGFLYVSAFDTVSGAIKNIAVMDTGMGHVSPTGAGTIIECQDDVILPAGRLNFYFYPSTTGTYQVVASVIPSPIN